MQGTSSAFNNNYHCEARNTQNQVTSHYNRKQMMNQEVEEIVKKLVKSMKWLRIKFRGIYLQVRQRQNCGPKQNGIQYATATENWHGNIDKLT